MKGGIAGVSDEANLGCHNFEGSDFNFVGRGNQLDLEFQFMAGLAGDGVGIGDGPYLTVFCEEVFSIVAESTGQRNDLRDDGFFS